MPNIFPTIQKDRAGGSGKKILMLLAVFTLIAFILIPPVSASQRMVLAEGYTNYQ